MAASRGAGRRERRADGGGDGCVAGWSRCTGFTRRGLFYSVAGGIVVHRAMACRAGGRQQRDLHRRRCGLNLALVCFAGVRRERGGSISRRPGPRVLVSNHASYLDVLVLMAALGVDYHFVAKREVHSIPFIGLFMRRLGHFAFDSRQPRRGVCAKQNS